jgi:activator of HSP90 ATPase
MSKAEGVGSVWNPNSWHWESKNYSQLAKAIIEEKFLGLVL